MTAFVAWQDLTVGNGSFRLNAGTWSLPEAAVVAVLGPNGAGKSTLLHTLAGLSSPLEGQVTYFDQLASDLKLNARAKLISWCPSYHDIPFAFSCVEVVVLGRFAYHGGLPTRRDRDIAFSALRSVDMIDFANRPVTALSSGERQRIMIARCLAAETPILILDEPTANLDAAHCVDIFTLLQQLTAQRGVSVLVSIHDINLVAQHSDFTLLLSHGAAHAFGPTKDTVTPASLKHVLSIEVEPAILPSGKQSFVINGRV